MRNTVDREPGLGSSAVEVDHIGPDRMLAAQFHPATAGAEFFPEQAFWE